MKNNLRSISLALGGALAIAAASGFYQLVDQGFTDTLTSYRWLTR